ncbi:MAG: hypothetical protein KIT22_06255 [Verrucomicrobiae bacterium]|nr:hypothetical protein [Verrucomicrobiae bacterium]
MARLRHGLWPWVALLTAAAAGFQADFPKPSGDRWMYPYNATPGTRPSAPVFSTFGDESGVDTRHGQFLLVWDTTNSVPAGQPARHYRLTRVQLTLIQRLEGSFVNDSTADAFETWLPGNDPRAIPDADPGWPIELFGAGFRNGFTADSFQEGSPFGSASIGERNAYAAGFNAAREFVDVSNNVGKTNALYPPFPTRAFSIGAITNVAAGEPVPSDTPVTFDLNLEDPDVRGYLQQALSSGRLWLSVSWLGGSEGFAGTPTYPDFATGDNLLFDPPHLILEGELIGPEDTDKDGLPDDWERLWLGGLESSGDDDDDGDGVSNRAEYELDTNPNDSRSLLAIRSVAVDSEGRGVLGLVDAGAGAPWIESSPDLKVWTRVPGRLDFREAGHGAWQSDDALGAAPLFFRAVRGSAE